MSISVSVRTSVGLAAGLAFAVAWVLPSTAEMPAEVVVPADPVAKAAFDVLDKHCARCHQDGMLASRLKPAKNFGHILRLDQIAADPHYIAPGNPDGSRIVQQILNKEMPFDVYYEADLSKPVPSESEIAA
ncbi:MAG: hypothetical protein GY798_13705, partial [Hyphomicrobiales bacterium]|nr:hypothetical protein [Hyphomicrobiales bacterium]